MNVTEFEYLSNFCQCTGCLVNKCKYLRVRCVLFYEFYFTIQLLLRIEGSKKRFHHYFNFFSFFSLNDLMKK